MKPGKVLLVVFGVLVGIVGVGLVIGGTAGLVFRLAFFPCDGFVSSRDFALRRSGYAIVSETARITADWPGGRRDLATIRIEVQASDPERALFVGIADRSDAQAYLAGWRGTRWWTSS